jgi:hypothetical protein
VPRTYQKIAASHRVRKSMAEALRKYHQPLLEAEVEITVLLASAPRDANDDPVGAAVMFGGYPAMATVKINNLKDRVEGQG